MNMTTSTFLIAVAAGLLAYAQSISITQTDGLTIVDFQTDREQSVVLRNIPGSSRTFIIENGAVRKMTSDEEAAMNGKLQEQQLEVEEKMRQGQQELQNAMKEMRKTLNFHGLLNPSGFLRK